MREDVDVCYVFLQQSNKYDFSCTQATIIIVISFLDEELQRQASQQSNLIGQPSSNKSADVSILQASLQELEADNITLRDSVCYLHLIKGMLI